jgi:ribosomal protein S18 acetylase RimI-like enzyme
MLRRASEEDADELAAILRTAMRSAMPSLPELHTPEDDRRFIREIVLPDEEVWVAETEGSPVGFASLGVRAGDDYLQHIYVAPEHQGQGIGTKLLSRAKERRPGGFRLWVFQKNAGARRFYEKHGLRLVEVTDGQGNEEREPDALYEWAPSIGESPGSARPVRGVAADRESSGR